MHDVVCLVVNDAVVAQALVAYASAANVHLAVSDLLLEGVVDILLDLTGYHVACWFGDRALVIVGLAIDLDLLLSTVVE